MAMPRSTLLKLADIRRRIAQHNKDQKNNPDWLKNEVQLLCDVISEYGELQENGTTTISFGLLFQIYSEDPNKIIGIMMVCQKYNILDFNSKTLYQRVDDHELVTLLKPMRMLREEWGLASTAKRGQEDEEKLQEAKIIKTDKN